MLASALAVGIVIVAGERRHRNDRGHGLEHRERGGRRTGTDGVAQRDLVAAHVEERARYRRYRGRRDGAFIGEHAITVDT